MPDLDRRDLISRFGPGLGGACLLPRRGLVPPGLPRMVEEFRKCKTSEAVGRALHFARQGASWKEIQTAVMLVAVQEVSPQPIGNRVHSIMMGEPAFALSAAARPGEAMHPVLFNLDYVKRSQHRDEGWRLPGAPAPVRGDGQEELDRGMAAWDEEQVDAALVKLARTSDKAELFELLWPWAARDFRFIGHKMIFCSAAWRMLARMGWQHRMPVLRSLVLGLLDGGGQNKDWVQPFAANQERARRLPKAWGQKPAQPGASRELLSGLRGAAVGDAAEMVFSMLEDGYGADTVWDGYRLFASEVLMRRPGIGGVHPMTSTHAMHFAFRTTRSEATRRLLILQNADWLALFRADFMARRGLHFRGPGIDKLEAQPAPSAAAALRAGGVDRKATARQMLALASDRQTAPDLHAELRSLVGRKARESHVYKYAQTMFEAAASCHPELAPRLIAASAAYLPLGDAPDAAVVRRARESSRKG